MTLAEALPPRALGVGDSVNTAGVCVASEGVGVSVGALPVGVAAAGDCVALPDCASDAVAQAEALGVGRLALRVARWGSIDCVPGALGVARSGEGEGVGVPPPALPEALRVSAPEGVLATTEALPACDTLSVAEAQALAVVEVEGEGVPAGALCVAPAEALGSAGVALPPPPPVGVARSCSE